MRKARSGAAMAAGGLLLMGTAGPAGAAGPAMALDQAGGGPTGYVAAVAGPAGAPRIVPAVQAFRNGRWAQAPSEPGDAGIVFTVGRGQITRLSMITSALCTDKVGSGVDIGTITIAGNGAPVLTMPPNGRASETAPFSDAGDPGTMTYRIRLKGTKGTARFHLELETASAVCVSDPVFHRLRWGH